jgi:lysophospholipase L1-like esterase
MPVLNCLHSYTSTDLVSDFNRIIERCTSFRSPPTLLFTIFVGANDACFIGNKEHVPWPRFSTNIRFFIETIVTQDAMSDTKIVIITPPPINGPEAWSTGGLDKEDLDAANQAKMEGLRYKTYMSKKRYAEGLMEIVKEYEETGRVIGLNFWRGIVEESGLGNWDEWEVSGLWPGSGLIGAKSFEQGWFTDGLHLDVKGYGVLNRMLTEAVTKTWPELMSERL